MNTCLLCGQEFVSKLSIKEIFTLKGSRRGRLCPTCRKKFSLLTNDRCPFCNRNVVDSKICHDCRLWQKKYGQNLLVNHSVYRYNDEFHELMVNYKRYGDYVLREVLQELCFRELSKISADLYVPIPSSPVHLKRRQFDTIKAIFDSLVPLSFLLTKKENGQAQGEKNRSQRLATVQSFSLVNGKMDPNFKGKILLLDDIYTTGRTLYHARDKLLSGYPQAQILSFTIAR